MARLSMIVGYCGYFYSRALWKSEHIGPEGLETVAVSPAAAQCPRRECFRVMRMNLPCQNEHGVSQNCHADEQRIAAPASDECNHDELLNAR